MGKIEKRGDSYILLLNTYYQDVSIKRYAMGKVCSVHGRQAFIENCVRNTREWITYRTVGRRIIVFIIIIVIIIKRRIGA